MAPNEFGTTASTLARNPLGIIALFIVMLYGFACLITASSGSLTPDERLPLIYFIVLFPVLVVILFGWLVSQHSTKLYAPSDFKNEDNYIKANQNYIRAAVSLMAASERQGDGSESNIEERATAAVNALESVNLKSASKRPCILWVDDRPENNVYERQAFEAVGMDVQIALSTDQALERMSAQKFSAIISDMGRREGPQEGYLLLKKIRDSGDSTPYFIYAGSSSAEHRAEAALRGAQGSTNNPNELFASVTKALLSA